MRRALIIGINKYEHVGCLGGCINDANNVKKVLERHSNNEDKEKNFDIDLITEDKNPITRKSLKDRIRELFRDKREVSLLYFSGHGYIESSGGYLITSECKDGDDGISMNDILTMVNESPANNKIVILDCCHAGGFGTDTLNKGMASIKEGVTIMAASASNQYSIEKNGSGVFTKLLIHALEGGAASILGDITPGNVYGYIDKAMGSKGQRPIFMTNVRRYTNLRKVPSQIGAKQLKELTNLFKNPNEEFKLDPSFEPESENPNEDNCKKFAILQKYNRVNLLIPVDAPHMYHAAMASKSCKLTNQGKSYWEMVKNNII